MQIRRPIVANFLFINKTAKSYEEIAPSPPLQSREAKRESSFFPLPLAEAGPDLCLLLLLRWREEVGISFLVSWRVDRVVLVPGGGEWKVRSPLRVNKVRLSPSPGAASGGAEVRVAEFCLCATARGFLSRRSVGSCGFLSRGAGVCVWVLSFILSPAGRGGEGRRWGSRSSSPGV